MRGNFGLRLLLLAFALTFGVSARAVRKGLVMNDEAAVFDQPDFDSTVIMTLQPGRVFDISDNKRGPFYKIRYDANKIGWISDADIQPISDARARDLQAKAKKPANRPEDTKTMSVAREADTGGGGEEGSMKPKRKASKAAKKKSGDDEMGGTGMEAFGDEQSDDDDEAYGSKAKFLHRRRYRGFVLEMVDFRENTMGRTQHAMMPFYGARLSGPNTLIGGDTYVDTEVVYHPGVPQYYPNATGNVASGYLVLVNMLLEADLPQSKGLMFFGGVGPALRFSHIAAVLNNDPVSGTQKPYNLDDLTLGAVVNAGAAVGFGRFALRADGRYYWETQGYMSFGLALQMDY